MLTDLIPAEWQQLLHCCIESEEFCTLSAKVENAYSNATIYPKKENIFLALELTKPKDVKVVIIGQDPYHEPGQAHGLAFSVPHGVKIPGSLNHIFQEIEMELDIATLPTGNLDRWAVQGVLLLNATLTVEAGKAGSHEKFGWQQFTAEIIKQLSYNYCNIAFMLWGNSAIKLSEYIDTSKHIIFSSTHPSGLSWGKTSNPEKMKGSEILVKNTGETELSEVPFIKNNYGRLANNSFYGSNQFKAVNQWLKSKNISPINWE